MQFRIRPAEGGKNFLYPCILQTKPCPKAEAQTCELHFCMCGIALLFCVMRLHVSRTSAWIVECKGTLLSIIFVLCAIWRGRKAVHQVCIGSFIYSRGYACIGNSAAAAFSIKRCNRIFQ